MFLYKKNIMQQCNVLFFQVLSNLALQKRKHLEQLIIDILRHSGIVANLLV